MQWLVVACRGTHTTGRVLIAPLGTYPSFDISRIAWYSVVTLSLICQQNQELIGQQCVQARFHHWCKLILLAKPIHNSTACGNFGVSDVVFFLLRSFSHLPSFLRQSSWGITQGRYDFLIIQFLAVLSNNLTAACTVRNSVLAPTAGLWLMALTDNHRSLYCK